MGTWTHVLQSHCSMEEAWARPPWALAAGTWPAGTVAASAPKTSPFDWFRDIRGLQWLVESLRGLSAPAGLLKSGTDVASCGTAPHGRNLHISAQPQTIWGCGVPELANCCGKTMGQTHDGGDVAGRSGGSGLGGAEASGGHCPRPAPQKAGAWLGPGCAVPTLRGSLHGWPGPVALQGPPQSPTPTLGLRFFPLILPAPYWAGFWGLGPFGLVLCLINLIYCNILCNCRTHPWL